MAVADADTAVAKAPANANAWRARGLVRQEKGDPKGAIEDFDHSIGIKPSSFSLLYRGLAHRMAKDDAAARKDFEAALDLDDRLVPAWVAWSVLMLNEGKADKAEAGAAKALAIWPDDAEALLAHASALVKLDRRPEAEADLKHFLEAVPEDSPLRDEAQRLLDGDAKR
jgi:tetratricopeptide (TPR) repeat protein